MLQKSPRGEKFGCLFGLVGGLVGLLLGKRHFARYVETALAEDPDAAICGLPGIPAMFGGLLVGGLFGALLGMILSHLLPPSKDDG